MQSKLFFSFLNPFKLELSTFCSSHLRVITGMFYLMDYLRRLHR